MKPNKADKTVKRLYKETYGDMSEVWRKLCDMFRKMPQEYRDAYRNFKTD